MLLTKTADTAHTVFASVTRPFSVVIKATTVTMVPTPLRVGYVDTMHSNYTNNVQLV